jgi:hypothetical protein
MVPPVTEESKKTRALAVVRLGVALMVAFALLAAAVVAFPPLRSHAQQPRAFWGEWTTLRVGEGEQAVNQTFVSGSEEIAGVGGVVVVAGGAEEIEVEIVGRSGAAGDSESSEALGTAEIDVTRYPSVGFVVARFRDPITVESGEEYALRVEADSGSASLLYRPDPDAYQDGRVIVGGEAVDGDLKFHVYERLRPGQSLQGTGWAVSQPLPAWLILALVFIVAVATVLICIEAPRALMAAERDSSDYFANAEDGPGALECGPSGE